MKRLWLSLLLGLSPFTCVQAQTSTNAPSSAPSASAVVLSEKYFLDDIPIVLSVSRLPQRLDETPGAVTILERDMIRASGARDVADLLRQVPGFGVTNSFESNTPQASYHSDLGSYAHHIQVLVDGRSVYSPYLLGSTGPGLQTVAMDDIERIEVMRGSNSAAYGARAFLGTINIVTRDTLATLGPMVRVAGGDNGIRDRMARFGWGDERASFRLSADQRRDDGLLGASGADTVSRFNFRADVHPGGGNDYELRLGQNTINANVGFAGRVGSNARERNICTNHVQFDWRRNLGPDQDFALQASHMNEVYRDRFDYTPLPGLVIDFSGTSSVDQISAQHTFRASSALRVVWGAEWRNEHVRSRSLYNTDNDFINDFSRLFANAEWRLHPDLLLNAGGMLEHSSLGGGSFSPRLMLNWHLADGHTLRLGTSKAFRPPSVYEKFNDVRYYLNNVLLDVTTRAQGHVESEKIQVVELGYLGELPHLGVSWDVRAFEEDVSGFIQTVNYAFADGVLGNGKAIDYVNEQSFKIRGLEYQLKGRLWGGAHLSLNQALIDSSWLPWRGYQPKPYLSSGLTFTQKFSNGINFSLMYHETGPTNFPGVSNQIAPAASRTDLRLAYPFRIGKQRGELSWVVQNLGPANVDFMPDFHFRKQAYVMFKLEN